MKGKNLILSWLTFVAAEGFLAPTDHSARYTVHHASTGGQSDAETILDPILESGRSSLRIIQESRDEGYSFKQTVANVLAGEYDEVEIKAKIDKAIKSAPCVMFSWSQSPSCVKAVEALEIMGAKVNNIRLDELKSGVELPFSDSDINNIMLDAPWSDGNPIRAELGKIVGRSSVPFVIVDGKYIGGYDGGVSDEAPGVLKMAFEGTLRNTLESAGVTMTSSSKDTKGISVELSGSD